MKRSGEPHPGPDCLNQMQLDRILAGEREGLQATHKHLKRCPICQERVSALEKEREATSDWDLMDRCVTRVLESEQERTLTMPQMKQAFSQAGKIKWVGISAVALLLLGTLVLIALPGKGQRGPYEQAADRDFMFVVMVQRDGQWQTLSTRDRTLPSDRFQITTHVPGPGRLWLVRTSPNEKASLIDHNGNPFFVVSGKEIEVLPLDPDFGPRGTEEGWIAVYCSQSDYVANMLDLLDEAWKSAQATGRLPASLGPCTVRAVTIRQSVP